jgi:long-chain acyl-CoA synthetase
MFIHEIYKSANPDSIALTGDETYTYGEMDNVIHRYRNLLYAMGVRQGDRVGLYSQNREEFVFAYMAVASLGAIIVPLNCSLVDREVAFIVKDAGINLLITDEKLNVPAKVVSIFELHKKALSETHPEAPAFPSDIKEDDVCSFVYTSGTTGSPKGAMLSHKNLWSNAYQFIQVVPFTPEDRVLAVLPMFHCYGWMVTVLATLYTGGTVVIMRTKSPMAIIHCIEREQVTIACMVPPMYHLLAKRGRREAVASVHFFICGGSALPQPVAQAFEERYGHPVLNGYGLTEASPVVSVLHPNLPKYLSVGPAIPGVEVKIMTEKPGPYVAGTVGELWVRGDNVMKGYWHREEETKHTLTEDGWLRTGDLAYLDHTNYIYIVDRIKDLIIVNGENIYPREVESCIYELPDVSECAVVGHYDELRGQAIWAYIVMKEGCEYNEEKIRKYLMKNLAAYKIPRRFIPMDALPKNATGKILKRALRH